MATINYKEKYEKAVRAAMLAKQDTESAVTIRILDDIFPELKESEDDRIRKALIDYFNDANKADENPLQSYGVQTDKAIAWLERQGETSHILSNSSNIGKDEQKPAWSEEDEKYTQGLIRGLKANRDIFKFTIFISDSDSLNITSTIDWLESLKNRVQPQEKQEWSKEDIDMIDWLIRCCEKEHEELCNDKYGHQDIVSDLKRDCRKKWDWIESLKNKVVPQNRWKPSDEQMENLSRAFNGGTYRASLLMELYQDLKKLK